MGDRLRCAVVGVGHLGRFHAQKYQQCEGAVLVGVCDARPEHGARVAAELGVPFFARPEELLGRVDAVTIAANTDAHHGLGKLFLGQGVHVNMEKPLASTSAEAEELCRMARPGLTFQVGHVERFNPALISARSQVQQPLFIECHRLAPFKPRSLDIDVVLDVMIHDLDVILSMVDSEPVAVSGVGAPVITGKVDIANARLEFASGTVANATASRVSQGTQRKFRVFQQDRYLSIDFGSGEVTLLRKAGDWRDGEVPLEAQSWSLEKGDALLAETQAFVDAARAGRPAVVTGRDGLKALVLAEQILADIERRLGGVLPQRV